MILLTLSSATLQDPPPPKKKRERERERETQELHIYKHIYFPHLASNLAKHTAPHVHCSQATSKKFEYHNLGKDLSKKIRKENPRKEGWVGKTESGSVQPVIYMTRCPLNFKKRVPLGKKWLTRLIMAKTSPNSCHITFTHPKSRRIFLDPT